MVHQEFDTVDVVRLEVETDPTGLVNLVQNPSGELGGWGWITTLSDSAMSGLAGPFLQYERTVAGASSFTTEALPIAAGQYAAARWEGVTATGAAYVRARFEWLNSAGGLLSSSAQTGYVSTNTTTGLLSAVVAPASTAFVRLRFDVYLTNAGANPSGSHLWKLHQVTVAKASVSGELGELRTNLVPNPSFETSTTGWSADLGGGGTTLRVTGGGGAVGSAYWRIHPTSAEAKIGANYDAAGFAGYIPVTGGADYTLSAYVRSVAVSRTAQVSVTWYAGTGLPISSASGGAMATSTGGWSRISATFTAPSSAAKVIVKVQFLSVAAAEQHEVDGVMLEQASSLGTYFDGATADAGGWDYSWTGTAHASTSTAANSNLGYLPPVEYLNIIGESHTIRVDRKELNAGSLSATILSRTLDPSQSTLLRPGRRARLTALVDGVWETVIGGKLLEADVTYELKNPRIPTDKQARIAVVLVDPTQALANAGRPEGVATIDELPFVLEGAGVPWNVNGSGNQVPTANVTTNNESAKALDQVALTRDTAIGYAWMSRLGVTNVWDRDQIASGSPILLDEDDYSDIDLSFSTKDVINEVQVTVQSLGADGTTTETLYGPYTDDASIEQWGRYRKEFTVTGLDSAAVDALAAAILAAAATPRIRVNSIAVPLHTIARMEARALLDQYDEVRVVVTALGVDDTLRVRGLEHIIETKKWMLRLDFSDEGGVAVPTVQPPVQSGIRPDVGVIELFAGSTPPPGKLLCDGSSYAVADYPFLFAVIGYTFGGAGAFFDVPDLTDRFPIGSGTKALGTIGGAASRVLTAANLPPHSHTINHGHGLSARPAAGSLTSIAAQGGGSATVVTSSAVQDHAGSSGNGPGSSSPVDILNPWLSLNFIIRAA
jgi:microcystin-dependent protein